MRGGHPGRVEDYTDAFLALMWLLGITALTLVWGVWGYAAALVLCAAAHAGIRRLARLRAAREAAWDARARAAVARGRARQGAFTDS